MSPRAGAETVYGTDTSGLYSVNSSTRATTLLFDLSTWSPGGTAWAGGGNALAYDAFASNLIVAERTGTRVAAYNSNTHTASVLANIDSFASVTSQITAGTVSGRFSQAGAFFYNDSYYFTVGDMDNGGVQHSRLFRAYINPGHTAISSIGVVNFGGGNPWLGSFGDLAVKSDGTIYGSSTGSGSGVLNGFWRFNINSPGAGITSINTGTPLLQLALSADGLTLFGSQYSAGDFGTVNMATGSYTASGSLSGATTSLIDMTQATSPVPEPSSALLLVLGVMPFFRRRSNSSLACARSIR